MIGPETGGRSAAPSIEGCWKFPFGEMPVTVVTDRIAGTVEIETEESGFGILFAKPGAPKVVRTDNYALEGKLTGAVCEFKLTIADRSERTSIFAPLLPPLSTKSGFILFAPDGKSATYVELSDHNLGKEESLTKVG